MLKNVLKPERKIIIVGKQTVHWRLLVSSSAYNTITRTNLAWISSKRAYRLINCLSPSLCTCVKKGADRITGPACWARIYVLSQSCDMFMSFLQDPILHCLAESLSNIADSRGQYASYLSSNKNRITHPIDPYQMRALLLFKCQSCHRAVRVSNLTSSR